MVSNMYKMKIISKTIKSIKANECPIEKSLKVILPIFKGPCTAKTNIIDTPIDIIPFI